MLTGDIPPSAGTAMINGRSIIDKPRAAQRQIGVCPQFDALVDKLTGREHLHLYCRLKGVPSKLVAPTSQVLDALRFSQVCTPVILHARHSWTSCN